MKVKLYIDLEGVGEKCTDDDITLDYTDTSLCFVVNNYLFNNDAAVGPEKKRDAPCLSFGRLTAEITNATFRRKKDRVVVTLTKAKEGEWHTINDKGSPDHDVV